MGRAWPLGEEEDRVMTMVSTGFIFDRVKIITNPWNFPAAAGEVELEAR
jgi:hypothetical protein